MGDRPTDPPLEVQFALAELIDRERLRVRERVAGIPRAFLGSATGAAKLQLRDPSGRVRARLTVDSTGAALEFVDETGAVTATFSGIRT